MLNSRLYLASNIDVIENASPLQHVELYLSADHHNILTYFGESYQDRPELRRLISQLRRVYFRTEGLDKETSGQAEKVMHRINQDISPKQEELGYCKETLARRACSLLLITHLPLLPPSKKCFFQKLDAMFAALEGYRVTHAAEILIKRADIVMQRFSRMPDTAFLNHPDTSFVHERPIY
ncbi:hypothetical protein BD779DRAFT_689977 [Infundibulicybe gibba]|nr:hypothetical protein BD779DRAFT_689977 [Infundibulicybe gibba]